MGREDFVYSTLQKPGDFPGYTYTVVVPVYNSAATIAGCIRSILNCRRKDVELLMIDDGSRDDSKTQICEVLKEEAWPTRVRYFYGENQGVSWARNVGIDRALGKYIVFIDSDDKVTADYFNILDQDKNQELAVFLMKDLSDTSENSLSAYSGKMEKIEKMVCDSPEEDEKKYQVLKGLLSAGLMNSASNKRFRLDLIQRKHLHFNENLSIGEDFLFALSYALSCRNIVCWKECIYLVNDDNLHSLSRGYRPNLLQQILYLYEQLKIVITESSLSAEKKRELLREVDFYHSKAVCSCIGELFKVSVKPYFLRRKEIAEICRAFDQPMEEELGYCSPVHRGLNWLLKHHIVFPIYAVTFLKKAGVYHVYRK